MTPLEHADRRSTAPENVIGPGAIAIAPGQTKQKGCSMKPTLTTPGDGPAPRDLYRFYDADGVLLYIGISLNAAARASEHSKTKIWWPDVARMDVEHFDSISRRDIEEVEKAAIRLEQPLHNITHSLRRLHHACFICEKPSISPNLEEDVWFHLDGSDVRACWTAARHQAWTVRPPIPFDATHLTQSPRFDQAMQAITRMYGMDDMSLTGHELTGHRFHELLQALVMAHEWTDLCPFNGRHADRVVPYRIDRVDTSTHPVIARYSCPDCGRHWTSKFDTNGVQSGFGTEVAA